MAGSSNFQQWNSGAANQETDSTYTSDAQRTGGAANPSTFASATANKLFYQLSTFICAFATMMANKGYTLSDASLTNLEAVLTNVMTAADMSAYAPLASPGFSGAPTAPTPAQGSATTAIPNTYWVSEFFATLAYVQTTFAPLMNAALTGSPTAPTPTSGDNSTHLATTAFVQAVVSAYQTALGFTPVQQGGGTNQTAGHKVYLGWDGTAPRIQIDSTDEGEIAMQSWVNGAFTPLADFSLSNTSGSAAAFKMPNGMIVQFGQIGIGTATVVNLPATFATGFYQVSLTNVGPGGGTMNCCTLGSLNVSSSQFKAWAFNSSGAATSTNVSWIAIGY